MTYTQLRKNTGLLRNILHDRLKSYWQNGACNRLCKIDIDIDEHLKICKLILKL
jgi:hypothetical protein